MRKKPDITEFTVPKDPIAFLEGGKADVAENPKNRDRVLPLTTPPPTKSLGRGRVQKIFNFPEDLADRLREEAFVQSRATGSRISEKDIVIAALNIYFRDR